MGNSRNSVARDAALWDVFAILFGHARAPGRGDSEIRRTAADLLHATHSLGYTLILEASQLAQLRPSCFRGAIILNREFNKLLPDPNIHLGAVLHWCPVANGIA